MSCTGLTPRQHVQRDMVGVLDADPGVAFGQRDERARLAQCCVELVAELADQVRVHERFPGLGA
jgi:hypothetical protein